MLATVLLLESLNFILVELELFLVVGDVLLDDVSAQGNIFCRVLTVEKSE